MKSQKNIKNLMIIATAFLILSAGCKKEFFDINDNPNSPVTIKISEALPTAELAIGQALGNDLKVGSGFWAQYWTQNPTANQYRQYDFYNITTENQRAAWILLYSDALTDLNYVIQHATEEQKPNYVAVATILKAYNFQILTDAYGDIPFSEAGRGEEGILSPKYDSQKDVYNGIINLLKDGISKIDLNSDVTPGTDDFIYGGDMHEWLKFANTALLRVYLRLSNVDPAKAQSGINELTNANAEFLGDGETARIKYYSTGGNTNPLYSQYVGLGRTRNLVAALTSIDAYTANNDGRRNVFYTNTSGVVRPTGNFVGVPNGSSAGVSSVSYPGDITGGSPNDSSAFAPVVLMSDFESSFLQAEAMEKGWMAGTAEDLYKKGITQSFIYLDQAYPAMGLGNKYTAYIAQAEVNYSTQADKLEAIYFQKWYAMNGLQNFESWTDGRRTGYIEKNMGATAADNKFFTRSLSASSTPLPARMLYPSTEVTRNVNFPGQRLLSDKVWWAK